MEARERFIKVDGKVYYESELNLMSSKQLKELIELCQRGIEDIEEKKADYKSNNTEPKNSDHFWEVIEKFESASIYLQSDIILISKILKKREPENDESEWYKEFYHTVSNNIAIWKVLRLKKITDEKVGFSI